MLVTGAIAAVLATAAVVGGLAAAGAGPFSSSQPATPSATPAASASSPCAGGAPSASPSGGMPSSTPSPSAAAPGALGFSHNSLFPAAAGDRWTYRTTTSGGTPTTYDETVVSATPQSGGQCVILRETSAGSPPVTLTALFGDDGRVTTSQFSGQGISASTQGVSFVIPSKADLVSGTAFTSRGTITVTGPSTQTVTVTTTSSGDGTEPVTLPAGTFTAYRLKLAIAITYPQAQSGNTVPIDETVDLVENVGIVRVVSDFGDEQLVSSNLVP